MRWFFWLCALVVFGGVLGVLVIEGKPSIRESEYSHASDVPWAGRLFEGQDDFGPVLAREEIFPSRYREVILLGHCEPSLFKALHERCSITQPLSAGYPEEADRMISPFTTIPLDNHQIKNPFQMFAGKVTSAERQYIVEVLYCEESGIIHIKLNDR